MDAYVYQAALWCGLCRSSTSWRREKPPRGADMKPADALQQIVSSNGFTEESDYDSDELLKAPYPDGGGEADSPQHCEGCGLFLELSQRGAHRACSRRRWQQGRKAHGSIRAQEGHPCRNRKSGSAAASFVRAHPLGRSTLL
jgi:hypothetical protein